MRGTPFPPAKNKRQHQHPCCGEITIYRYYCCTTRYQYSIRRHSSGSSSKEGQRTLEDCSTLLLLPSNGTFHSTKSSFDIYQVFFTSTSTYLFISHLFFTMYTRIVAEKSLQLDHLGAREGVAVGGALLLPTEVQSRGIASRCGLLNRNRHG